MRLSYKWLSEYVDLSAVSPELLAERLTSVGLAVDAVEYRNEGVAGVVVGLVQSVSPHPDANRLHVCQVDVGAGELVTIVCGAPNVAADQRVPVALPGATLPGGVQIQASKLRGVLSSGMLCSAKELGLPVRLLPSSQTVGLYILPPETPIGQDIVTILDLDDVILEVDLTPNRSDCLSMRGFAYEVAAIFDCATTFPTPSDVKSPSPMEGFSKPISICIETPLCPHYEAQLIDGVTSVASPLWMQNRLLGMGIRLIDAIVDVTNYVMLEWGQPMHAFDAGEVTDATIVVRGGVSGETIVTLDGQTRTLSPEMIVIADTSRAIGLAGVMGGANSEVTAKTSRIILESAAFHAVTTRRTGAKLGLHSEAAQRFEKGIDPAAIHAALLRATILLNQMLGARPMGEVVVATNGEALSTVSHQVPFSPARCNVILGTNISSPDIAAYLNRLGFMVEQHADAAWDVHVPSRRADVQIEEDLVEEVGRLHGLDNVPSTLLIGPMTPGLRTARQQLKRRTRNVLAGEGLDEVFTYAFSHPQALAPLQLPPDSLLTKAIALQKPLSDERTVLRTHMLPSLVEVAAYNLHHSAAGGQIFELGRVYWPKQLPVSEQPDERDQLAMLWFGRRPQTFYQKAKEYDFFDAKGAVEAWLKSLGLGVRARFRPVKDVPYFHPGIAAAVLIDEVEVGTMGVLHPVTAAAFDLPAAIYAEFSMDKIEAVIEARFYVSTLPKFPSSRRDFAFVVKKQIAAAALLDTARMALDGSPFLQDAFVFDAYAGTGVADDEKSVALAFVFQAEDRTLTDAEVDSFASQIVLVLANTSGARLRQ